MATFLLPSWSTRLPSTLPWSTSDGAVRKYRPLSSYVSKAVEVLAGENSTTPAPTILSMTLSETLEDAAPMMTSAFAASSLSTEPGAIFGVPSPESALLWATALPSTPPASLMSLTARSTPANSGGPRNARSPVDGSRVPTVRTPSPLGAADVSSSPALSSSPPPQAASTSALAAATAASRIVWVLRFINPPDL